VVPTRPPRGDLSSGNGGLHPAEGRGAAMVAKVGGVFGTLAYPHLIRPYLGYYGHLASHYGGPWCPPIPCLCNKTHSQVLEPPVYGKMVGLPVLSVLTMGIPHTKQPPYDFLNLYGACMQPPRTPKMK
jgi:hypothetical protein